MDKFRTICGFCHTTCGMVVQVKDGKMVKVKGDPDHPASKGYLCAKADAAVPLVYHTDRLKHPLMKTSSGFKRVSWDEALDFAGEKLLSLREKYGPKTLVRAMGAPYSWEGRDGFHQLLATFGSTLDTGMGHICSRPRQLGVSAVLGQRIEADYGATKMAIFWGGNVTEAHRYNVHSATPNLSQNIPTLKKRGAKVVVIDPVGSETAALAHTRIQLRLGTDLALALALIHVIIHERLYDREFVETYSIGFDRLKEHVVPYTPEWASPITGLPAAEIREFARAYATTKPATIYDGNGLDMHTQGVETCRAIAMLEALTGNVDKPGGNVFMPWSKQNSVPTVHPAKDDWEKAIYPLFPEIPFPAVIDLLLTDRPERPRAMIAATTNPAIALANSKRTRAGLSNLELLIVSDHFMTATAELAHLVLPDATPFERYGYRAFASPQGCFFNLRRKVLEPLGEARPVFEVEYALARKMGLEKDYPFKNHEEWIDFMVKPSGISFKDLLEKQIIFTTPPVQYEKYKTEPFLTASGKIEFFSERFEKAGYDAIPTFRSEADDTEVRGRYPLLGTSRKQGTYSHTKYRNIPEVAKHQPHPFAWMHEDDAKKRGIENGSWVEVESPQGRIELEARTEEKAPPGVVIVDYGWGNPWDKEANINFLTNDQDRDPISGGTQNRLFYCEVRRK